ncbi:MAG: mechanosensitive ion channel family protein [Planctomycetota bacterium]
MPFPPLLRNALVVIAVAGYASHGSAQKPSPLEPADTSSPRGTLRSFLDNGRDVYQHIVENRGQRWGAAKPEAEASQRRMFRCLDVSQQPGYLQKSVGAESAVCLLEVFSRIELPPDSEIPGEDDPRVVEGELQKWRVPDTDITIVRMPDGPRRGEYLLSADTVERAPDFYERVRGLPYQEGGLVGFYEWFLSEPGSAGLAWVVHRLPGFARVRVSGQAVWQWVGLAVTTLLGGMLMIGAYRFGSRRAQQFSGRWRSLTTLAFPIAAATVPLLVRRVAERQLVLSGFPLVAVKFAAAVAFLLTVVAVIVSAGNRVADFIIASPRIHPRGIDAQFIRIAARVTSLALAVIVFLEGGQYLGIPLTTLLAGAGVGGLTIALAAQDTMRNLFGSLMIMLDKPFRVGERIIAKGYDGVVEEIGLRSTRLRLLTGHEATIPNDDMARSDIENIGRRPHIRRITDLALPLDLSPEQAERALSIVKGVLAGHEGMHEDFPPRVFLADFQRDAMQMRMMYWYHPPNYWDFVDFSERVNLRIKRGFAEAGIAFALPTSETHVSQGADAPLRVSVVDSSPPTTGE